MAWETINPANVTGLGSAEPAGTGTLTGGPAPATRAANHPPLWSPDNPLFWVAVVLAGTVGLYALSVSVKAGGTSASVKL